VIVRIQWKRSGSLVASTNRNVYPRPVATNSLVQCALGKQLQLRAEGVQLKLFEIDFLSQCRHLLVTLILVLGSLPKLLIYAQKLRLVTFAGATQLYIPTCNYKRTITESG